MSTAASNMNHAVVTKIMDAIRDITDEKVTAQDIIDAENYLRDIGFQE